MGFIRKLSGSAAALTAMVAPSVASAAHLPGGNCLPPGHRSAGSIVGTVGPGGALYVPRRSPAASGASTQGPAPSLCSPAAPPSRAWSPSAAGWSTSPSLVGPPTRWSPASPRTSGATISSASTGWTARTALPSSRTSARVRRPSARDGLLRPHRLPVRDRALPRRVPRHRRAPQPGAEGHPRWRDTELIAFGDVVPTGLAVSGDRSTSPRPDPSPTIRERQGRRVRTGVGDRHQVAAGARLASTWSSAAGTLFALSQGFRGRPHRGNSGADRTPARSCGSTGTAPSRPSWRAGPADLG